jgi:CHAT domain-containing protein
MVAAASRLGDALLITESFVSRSKTLMQLGETEGAQQDLVAAREWARRIGEDDLRLSSEADVHMAAGKLALLLHAPDAILQLDRAIDFYSHGKIRFLLPELYRNRAQAAMTHGDLQQAEEDIRRGIMEYEAIRQQISDEPLRISYFDQARLIFKEMVSFQAFRRQRPDLAFEYEERGRAQALLDALGARSHLPASELQSRLPENVAVIEFSIFPQQTLAWVITRKSFAMVPLALSSKDLTGKVENLRRALEAGSERMFSENSQELYSLLFSPLESRFRGASTLVNVADDCLHGIPFPALRNPLSGRFLIEEKILVSAPSASHYAEALMRARELGPTGNGPALVIGDPVLDTSRFSSFSPLPNARREAEEVASLYPGSVLLLGQEATKEAFLSQAEGAGIVHLAAHARMNAEFPLFSQILLASRGAGDAALYAHELYGRHFPRAALVVLAGCETGSGRASSSEGAESLARPFLAGGVPAVIASLWRVQDGVARQIFIDLHRSLIVSGSPAQALREAQVAAINSNDPLLRDPANWASFVIIGGSL